MDQPDPIEAQIKSLRFYLTAAHDCHYIEGQTSVTLFVDPQFKMSPRLYSHLSAMGFRRSGEHVYRPHCPNCRACLPLRVPVDTFRPNRSQRRIQKRNTDLRVETRRAVFDEEHFRLYRNYMSRRHPGSGMDTDEPEAYHHVFASAWSETLTYDFYAGDRLLGVAITDVLDDALSAVYTFFDPDEASRGLGSYAILWQIQQARREQRHWLYLGYWIAESDKMAYKARFRPHQYFDGARWRTAEDV